MQNYDAIIIGAGHNGLTCAAYLGKAGLKVKVVERRAGRGRRRGHGGVPSGIPQLGRGLHRRACSTRRSSPTSRCIEHGLRIVERRAQNFLPTSTAATCSPPRAAPSAEIAKFSAADAERYDAFSRELDASRRRAARSRPAATAQRDVAGFSLRSHRASCSTRRRLGNRLRRLVRRNICARSLDLFTKSAGDYLDGWFEGDLVKALLRLRRDRRQLREPLHAGHRLRAAAPRLRRSERQAAAVGSCDRRDGRDHAGHGTGGARATASRSRPTRRCARS